MSDLLLQNSKYSEPLSAGFRSNMMKVASATGTKAGKLTHRDRPSLVNQESLLSNPYHSPMQASAAARNERNAKDSAFFYPNETADSLKVIRKTDSTATKDVKQQAIVKDRMLTTAKKTSKSKMNFTTVTPSNLGKINHNFHKLASELGDDNDDDWDNDDYRSNYLNVT